MNVYDIDSLKNRINLMENELEMLKRWVDLLIKENSKASDIGIDYDKRYFKDDKLFDDLINHIQKMVL